MAGTEDRRRAGARMQVIFTAILFSTGGAAIKAVSLGAWSVAGFRSGIAALMLLAMLPEARRGWSGRTLLVGTVYGSTMLLFVLANKLTTAANTIYLQSTAPLYTLFLGPWLLKEPVRRRDLAFMAALAAGLAMFFAGSDSPTDSAPAPFRGNLLAAICGVTWALSIVGLRWLGKKGDSPAAAVVTGNALTCCVALPFLLAAPLPGTRDAALLAYLGIFQIGLAYVFLTRAVHHVPALEVSLLLLLEPVLNPVWAWLVHGEMPRGWSLAGCLVILVAMTVQAWPRPRGKAAV
jgi:drug/metabolite transporter (DMT)-like permease